MNHKFRYALVGCGKVAGKHMKAFLHNQDLVEMVAIADTNPTMMKAVLDRSGLSEASRAGIACYTDYAQMFREQSLDIVSITTPSGTHAAIGLAAVRAGVNLLIEKPMTLSLEEADLLLSEAGVHGVKIALGHIYRFFPFVDEIVRDIEDKVFGDVLYGSVHVHWGHDQAYYDQAAWRGTWMQDGGALMNQSIHALDLMCWLMGSTVCEVSGMIARQSHDMEAEDLGLGLLRFKNGALCTVEGTTNTDPEAKAADFYLLCTKGSVRAGLRSGKPYLDIRDGNGKKRNRRYILGVIKNAHRGDGLTSLLKLANPHSGILRDLCKAIHEDRNPRADGESGRNALELVLAIYKSAKTREPVRLPLEGFSTGDMTGYFDSCHPE
jgi:predicted dehydrogenase